MLCSLIELISIARRKCALIIILTLQGLQGFVIYDTWTRFYSGSALAFACLGAFAAAVATSGLIAVTCLRNKAGPWLRLATVALTASVLALSVVFYVAVFAIRPGQTDALKTQMEQSIGGYEQEQSVHTLWDRLQVNASFLEEFCDFVLALCQPLLVSE